MMMIGKTEQIVCLYIGSVLIFLQAFKQCFKAVVFLNM